MKRELKLFRDMAVGDCFTYGRTGNFTHEKIDAEHARNMGTGEVSSYADSVTEFLTCRRPRPAKGDRVKLRPDVLQRHARSVPAHAGYTREQFQWRDTLRALEGQTGEIERVFDKPSKYVNVQFPGVLIGIDYTELMTA